MLMLKLELVIEFNNLKIYKMLQPKKINKTKPVNIQAKDNTAVNNTLNARLFKPKARNKTDEEYAAEREANIQASVKAQSGTYTKKNWRDKMTAETQATSDKFRVSLKPNTFDDYLNPAVQLGKAVEAIGSAPKRAKDTNSIMPYVTSVGGTMAVGALGGLGAKNTGQFINNLTNPVAGMNLTKLPKMGLKSTKAFIKELKQKTVTKPEYMLADIHDLSNKDFEEFIKLGEKRKNPYNDKYKTLRRDILEDGESWKYADPIEELNTAEQKALNFQKAANASDLTDMIKKSTKAKIESKYSNIYKNRFLDNPEAKPVSFVGSEGKGRDYIKDVAIPKFDEAAHVIGGKHTKTANYISNIDDYTPDGIITDKIRTEMQTDAGKAIGEFFNKPYKVNKKDIPLNAYGGTLNKNPMKQKQPIINRAIERSVVNRASSSAGNNIRLDDKPIAKKKIIKAELGSMISAMAPAANAIPVAGPFVAAGAGLIGGLITANAQKKEARKQKRENDTLNFNQAVIEQDVYAKQFNESIKNDVPVYAIGGEMEDTNDTSTMGEYDTVGGDLIPIANNAEVVSGNTHNENNIDGSYGVTLSENGEPKANVEDKEVIVDNNLVFSDKLKTNGRTFASIALDVNTKIGELETKLKSSTKPAEKFSLERTIQGLKKSNKDLFAKQELVKQNTIGDEEQTTEVEGNIVPKAGFGFDLSHLNVDKFNESIKDASLDGIGDKKSNLITDMLPMLTDNLTNAIVSSKHPKVPKPTMRRAPILDTRVNVNPQLAEITNAVNSANKNIINNTNNSAVARANMTSANLRGAEMKANIYANKEDKERQNNNQQLAITAANANVNAGLLDTYNTDVRDAKLEQNSALSANVANAVGDYEKVKKNENMDDAYDELIMTNLLNDPNGEAVRTFKRLGKSLSPARKALLYKEQLRTSKLK